MIAKNLTLQAQPTGSGVAADPSEGNHFVRKSWFDTQLAPVLAAMHAAVTKQDTNSVAITLTGQQVSAAVRRKSSPGSYEGAIGEDADGLFVSLGSGANQAARGSDLAALQAQVDAIPLDSLGIADITGLQAALDGKANLSHTHTTGDVTGLDAALAGKAAAVHTHVIDDVQGLSDALAALNSAVGGTIEPAHWRPSVGSFVDLPLNTDLVGTTRVVRDERRPYICVTNIGFATDQWKPWDLSRKVVADIGDGVLTDVPFVHNLATLDVVVSLRDSASGQAVLADWKALDANSIQFSFASAPASGQYRATVLA